MKRHQPKTTGYTLWSIDDQLRGAMDADDFRDYMLSTLFRHVELDHFRGVTKMIRLRTARPSP
jgi:type I restriction enzyme M protein